MPTYVYKCAVGHEFEVIKRIAEMDRDECCQCGSPAARQITKANFYGADQWDKMTYDPVFKQVVKNDNHRRQLAKERGWVEVGNEKPETIHRHADKNLEQELENNWSKV